MIYLTWKNAPTVERNLGSDFMTEIYTLPTCPICEMIKKKLNLKEIPYVERSFEELPDFLDTDRAPVLVIDDPKHPGYFIYLLTPTEINNWIKEA